MIPPDRPDFKWSRKVICTDSGGDASADKASSFDGDQNNLDLMTPIEDLFFANRAASRLGSMIAFDRPASELRREFIGADNGSDASSDTSPLFDSDINNLALLTPMQDLFSTERVCRTTVVLHDAACQEHCHAATNPQGEWLADFKAIAHATPKIRLLSATIPNELIKKVASFLDLGSGPLHAWDPMAPDCTLTMASEDAPDLASVQVDARFRRLVAPKK